MPNKIYYYVSIYQMLNDHLTLTFEGVKKGTRRAFAT